MKKSYTSCLRYSFILLATITLSVSFTKTSYAQAFGFNCTNPGGFAEARSAAADPKWIFNNTNAANKFSIQWQENGTGAITCGYDNNDNIFKWGTTALGTGTFLKMTPSSGQVDFTGNVAIGGPSNAKLHVTVTEASNGLRVQNDNAGDGDPILEFNLNGTSAFTLGPDDSDADKFKISAGAALGTNDRFVIQADGNIGMGGAASPIQKLHILSAAASDGIAIENNAAGDGDAIIRMEVNAGAFYAIGVDDSDGDRFKISNSTAVGTNDRLTIEAAGNVGIGTTTPKSLAEVKGSFGVNAVRTVSGATATTTLDATDFLVNITPDASTTHTIALPAAATCPGRVYVICHKSINGTVTIDPDAAELVNGLSTLNVAANKSTMVICDGTNWTTVIGN